MLRRHLKIAPRAHTGKVRSHEHTSYLPLAIVLLFVGFMLTTYTATAESMTWTRPGPAGGSIGINGTMPGKPPTKAATIGVPANGQHFTQTPVTVSGTCPNDTLVEVFKNDIFAGSTTCDSSGKYSLEIDLMIGANVLVARVYDALNQAGPDSNSVTVYYDAASMNMSGMANLNFGGPQLLLNTDAVFRGAFPDKEMTIPLTILGGRAPYAVNVQWGDSTNTIVSRPDNSPFRTAHVYKKPGTFQLSVQATDADGRVAFITVASIVNGQPDAAVTATQEEKTTTNTLLVLWPLYAAVFAVVVSFWLGEWRERRVLAKHGLLTS